MTSCWGPSMPINNRIADLTDEIAGWRHDFHAHPELQYDVQRTAARIAELLTSFGVDEVATGIGRTGVVGVIRGNRPGKVRGLRAEMDALPMTEATGLDYASITPGHMHACGHDGHSAMLLGAAKYLAESRDFAGTAVFIFQPAEEGGAGGRAMAEDGLFSRWPIEDVYALHNLPGVPLGQFVTRPNAIMASVDTFDILIEGRGGHAAWPHVVADTIVATGQIITALQTIVSRETNPLHAAVVSVTRIDAGTAYNVMPDTARLSGTLRALDAGVRDRNEQRLIEIAEGIALALNVKATVTVDRVCGVVINDPACTSIAAATAADIAGPDNVATDMDPLMGGDDFCYLLDHRPGSYVFVGNGDSAGLHTVTYDFNDQLIPIGVSYWVRLMQGAGV